ncbi:MAG TPA: thioredoxin domain-containing protein, partial [Methylophilaceae bacterium]|nr:thioredoxin domain-containing protein [Methylophilaceae bacterium]
MNELFVNVKVDREERPDIDQIYQTAHNLLSRQSGGWPLTVFLTPEQEPFFTGTYFPREPRYQLPGFGDLITRIAAFYHERKPELAEQNASLLRAMAQMLPPASDAITADESTIRQAFQHLRDNFDFEHGGFGSAPKFPNPADIEFFLRQASQGNIEAEAMALQMLRSMAAGGIYDQFGGGFCRYSVDERWMIPHFEKMLYDNGQLLALYANGWQLAREKDPGLAERFSRVLNETVEWLLREMRSPEGAFYSSLDADSPDAHGHNEEGAFYVWQPAELMDLLTPEEYALALECFGLEHAPNFEGRAWHPYLAVAPAEADLPLFDSMRAKLFAAREKRPHPGRDDKILTSWNALAIKGLARAGRVLAQPQWIAAAQQAVDFIRNHLWVNNRLLATCKDDRAHLDAYLDDYAFLLDALLELMQVGYRPADMQFAVQLADILLQEFAAPDGGFYFTGRHHEALIHRIKQGYDNATPNGNGIAAAALQRLGHVLGETRYLEAAEGTLKAFDVVMQRNPAACPSLLMALEEWREPSVLVILRGPESQLAEWKLELNRKYLPNVIGLALSSALTDLPAALHRNSPDVVNAWVCRGVQCLPPVDRLELLLDSL